MRSLPAPSFTSFIALLPVSAASHKFTFSDAAKQVAYPQLFSQESEWHSCYICITFRAYSHRFIIHVRQNLFTNFGREIDTVTRLYPNKVVPEKFDLCSFLVSFIFISARRKSRSKSFHNLYNLCHDRHSRI